MRLHLFTLALCSLCLSGFTRLTAQTPSQSTAIASVPSWFTRCAGENGQCAATGSTQFIFGSSNGSLPRAGGSFVTQTVSGGLLCSGSVFGDPDPGHSKACWYGPPAGLPAGKVLAVGGSDYPFYVQNFTSWDDNQRVVVGLYHLFPSLVQAQLQQMYASGQRNVALVIWYMPFDSSSSAENGIPATYPDVWGPWINSSGGQLSTQAQANLTAILGLVKTIGFQQVTLRMAPIDYRASPSSWGNTWNEAYFQQDEAFEFNVRSVAEAALKGSSVARMYDLGIELGGIPHNPNGDGTYSDGQTPEWTSRLWADYVKNFGKADSFGFSMAYAAGTLTTAIAEYDAAGTRPNSYAIDLGPSTDLWNYYQELLAAGETAKPVIIQETSYNDTTEDQGIQTELQHVPLTVSYIDQWPVSSTVANADASPPTDYSAYGGSTATTGTLIVPPCTLPSGQTSCTTQASWSTSNASNVVLYVNGVAATNAPNITTTLTGTSTVTLGLLPTTFALTSSQGVVSTQGASAATASAVLSTAAVAAVDPYAPVVTLAGLGGSNNRALWAIGSNIASGCSVQLYDPASTSSSPLVTITNPNCSSSSLSFAIPMSILTNYSAVNMTVSNSGSHASTPVNVPLQSVPVLALAGLGGTANGAIWAIGSNISDHCTVQLYDPKASASAIANVTAVNCGNALSFAIPGSVLGNYKSINMAVTNADGQSSSMLSVSLPQ